LALFLFIGSFHLHFALTVGDWDFWVDWKDRQWWPLVTPLMGITFPAAVQSVMWTKFRLPMGATLCVAALLIGTWITRIFAYHYWNYFPINMVLPATMLPGALVLDAILMLSNSLTVTAVLGGASFALLFYPSNWPLFGMFHVPVEYGNGQLTVADLFGFEYIRTGMPEYFTHHRTRYVTHLWSIRSAVSGILFGAVMHPDVHVMVVYREVVRNRSLP